MNRIIIVLFIVLFSFLLNFHANCQKGRFRELTVGDTIPDVAIENIINYKTKTAHLSDFKGKLLIIDFWATWCLPCIASFPKLDSLQKKFANAIQILPVTYEETNTVSVFLQKMNKITKLLPMSSTKDKVFNRYFKHTTLPHYVWIDGNDRKIVAITEAKDVTESNIISFKKAKRIDYTLKKDEDAKLRVGKSFFVPSIEFANASENIELAKLSDSSVLFYSLVTNYVEGLESGMSFGDSTYINTQNITLRRLYQIALMGNGLALLNVRTTEVEVSDSVLYRHITGHTLSGAKPSPGLETLEWLRKNGYCYSIKLPATLAKQRFNIMLAELNRYFGALYGIEGVLEKRKTKYLSLSRIPGENNLVSSGGDEKVEADKLSISIKNGTMASLVKILRVPLQAYPLIIDETGFIAKFDLELNCQLSDLQAVNRELKKFGLSLFEKEKVSDVAIIRNKQ